MEHLANKMVELEKAQGVLSEKIDTLSGNVAKLTEALTSKPVDTEAVELQPQKEIDLTPVLTALADIRAQFDIPVETVAAAASETTEPQSAPASDASASTADVPAAASAS